MLSPMRLALIVLGVLFVLAVWIFNKFQERRLRRSIEAPFAQSRRDALFEGGTNETASTRGPGPAVPSRLDPVLPFGRAEPSFVAESAVEFAALDEPSLTTIPLEELDGAEPIELDESIHALIPLTLEQPVSGDRVLATLQPFRHAGRQTVTVLGGRDGAWYAVRSRERFDAIVVAIQLASRSGPLNEVEFSEFVTRLESAAEQIPARCDVPDMIETIARARNLDACCAPLDAQIGVTLANPEGVWSAAVLAEEAEALGLVLRSDGRFHAALDDGTTLFVLQTAEGPGFRVDQLASMTCSRVTFLLDLPRAPRALDPYQGMIATAQRLAVRLSAVIVDDQLRTLTPSMLESIGKQIEPVYTKLDSAGLPAGSPRALALFS